MASTRVLLSSSSPTPAHQLHHPFRRFDPQPSPLSNSQLFRNRNTLQNHFHQELNSDGYLDDDDDDEELALNEGQDFVEDHYGDEAECQSFQDEAADDNDEVESSEANPNGERDVEADDDYEDGDQQSLIGELDSFDGNYLSVNGLGFSPTLDASFATSMSIGTIPPTPSINNTLDSPSEPRNSHSLRHGQTSFLPAHLFAPNPNAMPPSSSPHRMDVSPVPKASRVNNPLNLPSPDPFRCPQRQWQPWSTSPPPSEARRTIALRKPCARPSIISPEPMAISSSELHKSVPSRSSPAAVTDGMDIDSPSYSQQHIIPPDSDYFEHSLEEFEDHSGPQHVDRSGSQCSIGKRSRSSEEELDEDSGLEEDLTRLSRPTSRGSGASKSRHPSSSPKAHQAGLMNANPNIFKGHWRRTTSVAGPSNLFAPRGGRNHGKFSFSPNSSPSQAVSPSVKAASSKAMSFGKKSDKSISGFKVSSSKSGFGPLNTLNAPLNATSQSYLQQYGASSLGAASGRAIVSGSRRTPLGVVQSSATLFSRHHSNIQTSSTAGNTLNRQRDAAGRPAFKARRAISFAATEGNLLLGVSGDDGDEEDEEISLLGPNCSPAPKASFCSSKTIQRHCVSNTWPKYGTGFNHHARHASYKGERDENCAKSIRKRSPPPPALEYLLPPPCPSHHSSSLQSPIRALAATISLGSTIESPVGLGFSEKERAGKILPCHKVSDDGLMRITPDTMDGLMEGIYDDMITQRIVIDCRFGYEYDGGHIKNAINVREKERVEEMLLGGRVYGRDGKSLVPLPSESGKTDSEGCHKKVILIFHCEYSAMRAPTIAKHLREKDRHLNMPHYPALHYPEVYILEGGYAKYFDHSPQHCEGAYVKMDDPNHKIDRDQDLNMFRNKEIGQFYKRKS